MSGVAPCRPPLARHSPFWRVPGPAAYPAHALPTPEACPAAALCRDVLTILFQRDGDVGLEIAPGNEVEDLSLIEDVGNIWWVCGWADARRELWQWAHRCHLA